MFCTEHLKVLLPNSFIYMILGFGRYAGCAFKNSTKRGAFGDALAEVDWIVGNVVDELVEAGIRNNTITFFTGDNGEYNTCTDLGLPTLQCPPPQRQPQPQPNDIP